MAKPFKIEKHTTVDKSFRIIGPDIDLIVDFDDVDHAEINRLARRVTHILNENWHFHLTGIDKG